MVAGLATGTSACAPWACSRAEASPTWRGKPLLAPVANTTARARSRHGWPERTPVTVTPALSTASPRALVS
jgi:hypothetical protein